MIPKILFFIGLLFPSFLFSQSFGNEWINYDQPYYRIKVAETGIYRIHKQALINSGIPIDALNPKNIQIFGREKELSIYINGEEDGSFDDTDFIEFVGQKNDGSLDSLLYDIPEDMLNPNYSLINDTLIYFLTWNSSTNNRRVTIESAQNFDSYPTSPYCWVTKQSIFNNDYLSGKRAGQIQNPKYTTGEGYGLFKSTGNHTVEFNTVNRITGLNAPDATFKTIFASANNPAPAIPEGNHHLRVQVQNQVVFDEIFLGYENFHIQFDIDPLTLSNTSQVIYGSVNDIGLTANDSYAIGISELRFAHNFNFENEGVFEFEAVTNSGFEKLKVEFDSFSGTNPILYAFGNIAYRNSPSVNGVGFRFLIPQNGEDEIKCIISSSNQIKLIENIEPANITGFFTNFSEQNLSNAFIIITENTVREAAQSYANYRSSKFNILLVIIDELYDQYGGGIEKHPLSIKRFIADLLQNWDEAPGNLFLFGKSIHPTVIRNNPELFASCLVPTIGSPASDNMYTAGLNGTILQTAVPTGRLATISNTQGMEYLNKVILFELQQPDTWMKHMLHFGGGGNTIEQSTFANYLNQYETTVSDTSFGAQVSTVLKNTSAPIQINVSEEITDRINDGVSMMTFFGHASGSGFDINIDSPENYENYGKYPLILASSCFVGDIHTTGLSNSEEYVLIPDKGSIAYIASTTTGVAAYLHAFNKKFHQRTFQLNYGTSIGKNLSRAVADIQGNGSDLLMIANCLEMTLHGDPSLVLNAFEKPDFATEVNRVYFEPEELTADIDSFKVKIPMDNLARATHQLFNVELIRHLPNNSGDSIYVKQMSGLLNSDTLTFTLAAHHQISDGLNTFDITLDVYEQVDELDNIGNNKVFAKEYFIKSSQIVPVYPYNQSIIDEEQPYLSSSTGDLNSSIETYHFQISQQVDFSGSPTQGEVSISGGIVQWQVPYALTPETVYYWRVAEASDANIGNWRTSSFEYIPDETGWGQASPFQFTNNQFDLLNYTPIINELSFIEGSKILSCNVFGGRHINANEVKLDLDVVDYGGCPGGPYIFVMVFDENTLDAWGTNFGGANPENDFGNVICNSRGRIEYFFAFNQNSEAQLDALYNMLSVEIPNGKHMLVYTYTFSRFDYWSEFKPGLFTLFQNLGSTLIDVTAPEQVPFIFYVQKGMTETVVEEIGQLKYDTLLVSVPLQIIGNNGKVQFTGGGFTSEIQEIDWSFTNPDDQDKFDLEIFQTQSGENISLFETNTPSGNEITLIDADPNLQISGSIKLSDTTNFTPLQFEHFRLFYQAVGDVALNPNESFSFESDTVQEGQKLVLNMALTNPTPYPMDSLTIRYSIIDIYNDPMQVVTRKLDSLLPNESLIDELDIETLGLSGKNRLVYQINPLSTEGFPEQPEQHRFNNEISIPFFVKTDDTQPILDVVFDGIHIMDGEIVSSKPNVIISLKDDNDYLVFEEDADTANIAMFITTPEGIQTKIKYGINDDGEISWKFDTNKNRFRINYVPKFEVDGKYHLLIQARDKSGNMSGANDYEISFEVINKSAITQVLNYPNPFTTKTYFVFTLTGDRIPDIFTIRIYTVSGKIVKEIHKQELGNIHIGNNITDYYWDGTDNFGDRLANGVYFYQVTVEFSDAIMESIETNADNYFKSGMGKMYLMR